jgi:cell division protein FtsQ
MSEAPPPAGTAGAGPDGPGPDGAGPAVSGPAVSGLAFAGPDGSVPAEPPGATVVARDPRAGGSYPGRGRPPGAPRGRGPRPRNRWRTAFFVLAGIAIVVGAGWALLGNRLLVVRSVSVTGTHLVTPAQVIAAADVPDGTPLLSVDAGAVTRRVEAIREVASATVSKNWPDQLVIAVTERVPVVAVKMADGGYDQVDPDGVIVSYTKAKPAALPRLVTSLPGSALRGNRAVSTAAAVLAELQPWLAKQVTEVKPTTVAAGTEQVTLGLRDGKTVQWGGTGGAAEKNRELAVLLPGGASDIDVSTPGTAVTR